MSKYIDADLYVEMQIYDDEHEEWSIWNGTIEELLAQWTEEGCPPTIEVSEDCISRSALIKEIKMDIEDDGLQEKMVFYRIKNAPSVVPSRAEGEWILECDAEGEGDNLYRCPECGQRCGCQEYDLPNYCGNCGAKMKG